MLLMDDLGHISQWNAIVAGSLSGMMAAVATYPTEVVKTRLIVQNRLDPPYKGILHALYMIYHQEGASALYRGVSLSVLGILSFLSSNMTDVLLSFKLGTFLRCLDFNPQNSVRGVRMLLVLFSSLPPFPPLESSPEGICLRRYCPNRSILIPMSLPLDIHYQIYHVCLP